MFNIGLAILALIFINLIISCLSIFLHIKNNKKEKEAKYVESKDAVVTQIGQREEQQLVDDMELLLVIATAIASYEGKSTSDFVVRSIIRR